MHTLLKSPSAQHLLVWLEAQEYAEALAYCEPFLKRKIRTYLRNFPVHYPHQADFFQEVYIHLLVKTFPSSRFKEACQDEQKFKHYFARTIFNQLNTLLKRERNQQRGMVDWEKAISPFETDGDVSDRATWLEDKAHNHTQESRQLLACLRSRFAQFMGQFQLLFPKIAGKLSLMLKLVARACITATDLKACLPNITDTDIQDIIYTFSIQSNYLEADDVQVFDMIRPYFERYRGENAHAQSLQRWINQQISGDKDKKGILAYMKIKDGEKLWEVQDKRVFTDFLHYHYHQEELNVQTFETEKIEAMSTKKSFWQKIFPAPAEVEMAIVRS